MGWNPFKKAESKAKEAVDSVIKKVLNPAINRAEGVGRSIDRKAKSAEDYAIRNIKKAGSDVEKGITEKIPDMFEDFVQGLAKGVAKEGLKKTQAVVKVSHRELEKLEKNKPGLVDAINDLGGALEIGPMTLAYSGFYTRMEEVIGVLDHYINEPPSIRRRDIIAMIKALGPDSVDLGISIQVVAVVVGSKELGVGGGLNDISIELFAEIADAILEAAGVPD